MLRRHLLLSVVAAGLAAAVALPASAQQKQVWKATDVHPLGYPTVEAIVRMGTKLEKATNGRISIQMYPSMQLGGEKEMIEQAQVGALQIARISVGAMGPVVDEVNVFNLPFVFRNETHMRHVIDGPIGNELLERMSAGASRLVALGWMDAGTRNVYANKPVTKPADLKGMKVRMMGNPIFVETMNAMGGNAEANVPGWPSCAVSLKVPTWSSYMTSSFHGARWKASPCQSKVGLWTTASPNELVTSRA